MERLDTRAVDRISGPAWEALRPTFNFIHSALVSVSPTVRGDLTTIYIKYTAPETGNSPFAVIWVKKSSELVVGLAFPRDDVPPEFTGPPAGCMYAGLTGYLKLTPQSSVPTSIAEWARVAFQFVRNAKAGGAS